MSIIESVSVSGYLIAIVFLVLFALFLSIKLFSHIVSILARRFYG